MSSHLGPEMANIFSSSKPNCYLHYFGDTFCLFNTKLEGEMFHVNFKLFASSSPFHLQKSKQRCFIIFNVSGQRQSSKFVTSVYWKLMFRELNAFGNLFCPKWYKINLIKEHCPVTLVCHKVLSQNTHTHTHIYVQE